MNQSRHTGLAGTQLLLHGAGCAILVVVSLVYFLLVHRPMVLSRRADGERAAQLTSLVRQSPQVVKENRLVNEHLVSLHETIAQVRRHVPRTASEGSFLADVTRIAEQEGLRITDYRRGRSVSEATHSRIDLGLKCLGTYEGLCRFLNQLEQLPRVSTVTQLTLQSVDSQPPYPFEIRLVLYFDLADSTRNESAESSQGAVL